MSRLSLIRRLRRRLHVRRERRRYPWHFTSQSGRARAPSGEPAPPVVHPQPAGSMSRIWEPPPAAQDEPRRTSG